MNILFLTNVFPHPGNPTKGTFNAILAEGLAQRNQVQVICPVPWFERGVDRSNRFTPVQAVDVGFPTYWYPPKVLRHHHHDFLAWSVRSQLRKARQQRPLPGTRPDIVLSYWAYPDAAVANQFAAQADIPSIVFVGGSDVLQIAKQDPIRKRQIQSVVERANRVLTVSHELRQELISWGKSEDEVIELCRGVDKSVFRPGSQRQAQAALAWDTSRHHLLWVGRFASVKGLPTLLEALRNVSQECPKVMLNLVGKGSEEEKIRKQVEELGLSDHVRFHGSVPHHQLPCYYQAADLAVLSSLSEGLPNFVMESAACNLPVVSTDVGAVRQFGRGKIPVVPPGDATQLAGAICRSLDNLKNLETPEVPSSTDFVRSVEGVMRQAMENQQVATSGALA